MSATIHTFDLDRMAASIAQTHGDIGAVILGRTADGGQIMTVEEFERDR